MIFQQVQVKHLLSKCDFIFLHFNTFIFQMFKVCLCTFDY
uniref:Uncharacterized protein n=2 Tax=Anguilla anguilla TaxID=7936 RepID=A0A0E9XYE6_ANGAN